MYPNFNHPNYNTWNNNGCQGNAFPNGAYQSVANGYGQSRFPQQSANAGEKKVYPLTTTIDGPTLDSWWNACNGVPVLLTRNALLAYREENVETLFNQVIFPLIYAGAAFYIVGGQIAELESIMMRAQDEDQKRMASLAYTYLMHCVSNNWIGIMDGNVHNVQNRTYQAVLNVAQAYQAQSQDLVVVTRGNALAAEIQNSCPSGHVRVLYENTKLRLVDFTFRNPAPQPASIPQPVSTQQHAGVPAYLQRRSVPTSQPQNAPAPQNAGLPAFLRRSVPSSQSQTPAPQHTGVPAPANSRRSQQTTRFDYGTASTEKGVLTKLSNKPLYTHGVTPPSAGAKLQCEQADGSRISITLGTRIGGGKEGCVYELVGYRDHCAKVLVSPSERTLKKVTLMMKHLTPGDYAKPEGILYTADNVFCGYIMAYYRWSVSLADVFAHTPQADKAVSEFDRIDFAKAAKQLITLWQRLDSQGVRITDLNPNNMVIHHEHGVYKGIYLRLIDLDSAQVDTRKLSGGAEDEGLIPGGGFCPGYVDPELGTFMDTTIVSEANAVYALAEAVFRISCVGVHPFDIISQRDGDDTAWDEYSAQGIYLYHDHRGQKLAGYVADDISCWLVSYLPLGLAELFFNLFHMNGMYRRSDMRPSVKGLADQLEHFVSRLQNALYQKRFPEALSLSPTHKCPFMHKCQGSCGSQDELVLGETLWRFNGQYLCKECATKLGMK